MEKEREKMMPAARRSVTAVAAREGREAATAEEELDEACDEGWRQRLRDLAGAEEEKMGRRGWRRSSAIETLLGRRRWPQRQRFRRRKQEGEPPMKMTTAAFLGDRGGGQRWERWWAMTGEVEGFLAFDGSGGSREREKRGRAGEGGHGAVAVTTNEDADEGARKVTKVAQRRRKPKRRGGRDKGGPLVKTREERESIGDTKK